VRYMVAVIAVLLMAISAFGVVAPELLVAIVPGWSPGTRLYVAVATRLVIGLIFVAGASRAAFPP